MARSNVATMLLVSVLVAGCETWHDTHSSATGSGATIAPSKRQPFLKSLPEVADYFARNPALRDLCSGNDERSGCDDLVYFDASGAAGGVSIDALGIDAPNLLVVFRVTEVSNVLVSGVGLGDDDPDAQGALGFRWFVDSPVVDAESPIVSTGQIWGIFPPGETKTVTLPIWRALVLDGCNTPPPVIPVEFRNEAAVQVSEFEDVGMFEAQDDTSLVPTGYWNFQYTFRATANDNADASDFGVRGTISVICTGQSSL